MKPHKGKILNWRKVPFDAAAVSAAYDEDVGLGYVVWGDAIEHPVYNGAPWFRTSWVMFHDELTGEIETRNSRYTLVGPEKAET